MLKLFYVIHVNINNLYSYSYTVNILKVRILTFLICLRYKAVLIFTYVEIIDHQLANCCLYVVCIVADPAVRNMMLQITINDYAYEWIKLGPHFKELLNQVTHLAFSNAVLSRKRDTCRR